MSTKFFDSIIMYIFKNVQMYRCTDLQVVKGEYYSAKENKNLEC